MSTLDIGTRAHTEVEALNEKDQENVNLHYRIKTVTEPVVCLSDIRFQNGPIQKAGANGIFNEDLICIVIDRLKGLQSGDCASIGNKNALYNLTEALANLRYRGKEPLRSGVEGTNTL